MSFSATFTIDASMIAMMSPSITVSVIIASGGLALRSPGPERGLDGI